MKIGKKSLPRKGYSQVEKTFLAMQALCRERVNSMRESCMKANVSAEHKLLAQVPCQGFIQNSGTLTSVVEQSAYIWFIGFVYRLRNALFHEIIDPLDTMWQHLFKDAYLVLKQIVDVNIARLNTMSRLREASFSTYKDAFISEPPPEIPIDQATTFEDVHIGDEDTSELLESLGCLDKDDKNRLNVGGLLLFGSAKALRRAMPTVRVDYIRVQGVA